MSLEEAMWTHRDARGHTHRGMTTWGLSTGQGERPPKKPSAGTLIVNFQKQISALEAPPGQWHILFWQPEQTSRTGKRNRELSDQLVKRDNKREKKYQSKLTSDGWVTLGEKG